MEFSDQKKNNSRTSGSSLGKGKKLNHESDAALGYSIRESDRPEGQVSSRPHILIAPPNHSASRSAPKLALFMRITPLGAHSSPQHICPRQEAAVNSQAHWHRAVIALWSASQLLTFKELSKESLGMNK